MRIAYVKSGDVVASLQSLRAPGAVRDDGGPNGFLADMLHAMPNHTYFLLGIGAGVPRDRSDTSDGLVRAIALATRSRKDRLFKSVWILRQILRFRPDVVICGKCGFLLWGSYLAARLRRVPFFHSRHNWHEAGASASRLVRELDNWIARHADAVVCHGPYLRDRLAAIGVASERTFEFDSGNQLLLEQAEKLAQRDDAPPHPPTRTLMYCGRVVRQKGVFDLLEAAARLFPQMPSLRLLYAGEGSDLEALQDEARRRGLSQRVDFAGEISHAEVGRFMRDSALVITPTRSIFPEGRCMVAMESLAVGTPVIAPRHGPFPYLVRHGENGLLFEPDSVDDLTACLRQVLLDKDLYRALRSGASDSGRKLLLPEVTFSQALGKAFALVGA